MRPRLVRPHYLHSRAGKGNRLGRQPLEIGHQRFDGEVLGVEPRRRHGRRDYDAIQPAAKLARRLRDDLPRRAPADYIHALVDAIAENGRIATDDGGAPGLQPPRDHRIGEAL
jgi:hypothetical protein